MSTASLSWIVKYYNSNSNQIEDRDILKYETVNIIKLKKESCNKDEFAEKLKQHFMYYYWSKCEWELIIENADDRIYLYPWAGCRNPEEVAVDVTHNNDFDWRGFAVKHIVEQTGRTRAKIDVWDQLNYDWETFVNYCWKVKSKYERTRK